MEFAFETQTLRDICESEAVAKERLGVGVAGALKRRLADFRAIDSFGELLLVRAKKKASEVTFDLSDGWQLVVTGGHGDNPRLSARKIDWSKITRIKIIKIGKPRE